MAKNLNKTEIKSKAKIPSEILKERTEEVIYAYEHYGKYYKTDYYNTFLDIIKKTPLNLFFEYISPEIFHNHFFDIDLKKDQISAGDIDQGVNDFIKK